MPRKGEGGFSTWLVEWYRGPELVCSQDRLRAQDLQNSVGSACRRAMTILQKQKNIGLDMYTACSQKWSPEGQDFLFDICEVEFPLPKAPYPPWCPTP